MQYAQEQLARGEDPTNEIIFPGVLSWEEYQHRRKTWDVQRQCVGLDAEFYEGPAQYLYPKAVLDACIALALKRETSLRLRWMGIDPAEGGDRSAWVVGDRLGILDLVSELTPNTNSVYFRTMQLMEKWKIPPENVLMDRSPTRAHANRLASVGFPIRTLAFGERVAPPIRSGITTIGERRNVHEDQTLYRNRRIQMYWEASQVLDPETNADGFAMPEQFARMAVAGRKSLYDQLRVIRKEYDRDGRPYLPPKNRQPGQPEGGRRIKSLVDLIGHSPDEADALVLMIHAMLHQSKPVRVGAL